MEKFFTYVCVVVLQIFLVLFILLIPFAMFFALNGVTANGDLTLAIFSDLLSDGNFLLLQIAFACICGLLTLAGVIPNHYPMGLSDFSAESFLFAIFGILFIIVCTGIELFIYKKILLNTIFKRTGLLIKSVSASCTVFFVLLANYIMNLMQQTTKPIATVIVGCIVLVILFFLQKKVSIADGYFASESILKNIFMGILKVIVVTFICYFIGRYAYLPIGADMLYYILNIICSCAGIAFSIFLLSEDRASRKIYYAIIMLSLFLVLEIVL